MIAFEWPWLFLLLPLPWLIHRLLRPVSSQEAALRVPTLEPFALPVAHHPLHGGRRTFLWLAIPAWALLVTAAARPVWQGEQLQLPVSGRDVLLAVDISGSMSTPDYLLQNHQVDRLTAVKAIAGDFIKRREGDRIGLILFGLQAYVQAPLTLDRSTVDRFLQESAIGLAGKETAIGDAIGLAIKELRRYTKSNKVLILLTDGVNDAGEVDPDQAAKLASDEGMIIYTIGIGANAMMVPSIFGMQRINPSQDLDEASLRNIAKETGGRYFRARDAKELENIYGIIDQLQPVERDTRTLRPLQSLFFWPLGIALLLSAPLLWLRVARP